MLCCLEEVNLEGSEGSQIGEDLGDCQEERGKVSFAEMENQLNRIIGGSFLSMSYQEEKDFRVWIDIKKKRISHVFGFELAPFSSN